MKGHTVEQCFKIVGYPEWFKGKKGNEARQSSANQIEVVDSPFDCLEAKSGKEVDNSDMVRMYHEMKEMMKVFKGKGIAGSSYSNFSGP